MYRFSVGLLAEKYRYRLSAIFARKMVADTVPDIADWWWVKSGWDRQLVGRVTEMDPRTTLVVGLKNSVGRRLPSDLSSCRISLLTFPVKKKQFTPIRKRMRLFIDYHQLVISTCMLIEHQLGISEITILEARRHGNDMSCVRFSRP